MRSSPVRHTVVGAFVLVGLGAMAYLSFSVGGLAYSGPDGLVLHARFDEIGGLKARAPVEVAGVKVGKVERIELDENYRARVTMNLDPRLELPIDTSASIVTSGILGDKLVTLQLGGEEETLESGDDLAFTESAVVLERLIGKLIHGSGTGSMEDEG